MALIFGARSSARSVCCVHHTEIRIATTAAALTTIVAIPVTSMMKARLGLNGMWYSRWQARDRF